MKIEVTAKEILDKGRWDSFCKEFGINPWAINEGQMDSEEKFSLSEEQAQRWGFIETKD